MTHATNTAVPNDTIATRDLPYFGGGVKLRR